MKELTDIEIQEIINKEFFIIPCSQDAKQEREDLVCLIITIKSLREQLATTNEKCRQYEALILDNANKNI